MTRKRALGLQGDGSDRGEAIKAALNATLVRLARRVDIQRIDKEADPALSGLEVLDVPDQLFHVRARGLGVDPGQPGLMRTRPAAEPWLA